MINKPDSKGLPLTMVSPSRQPSGHLLGNIPPAPVPKGDLAKISHEISGLFSPVQPIKSPQLNCTKISAKELLAVSQNISQYYAPKVSSTIKGLVLLPIDPDHLYVYWNFSDETNGALTSDMSSNNLSLKIYPQSNENSLDLKAEAICDIPVHHFHARKKITVPRESHNASYLGYIGTHRTKDHFIALLKSNQTQRISHKNVNSSDFKLPTVNFIPFEEDISANKDFLNGSSTTIKSHYASSHRSGTGYKNNQ